MSLSYDYLSHLSCPLQHKPPSEGAFTISTANLYTSLPKTVGFTVIVITNTTTLLMI